MITPLFVLIVAISVTSIPIGIAGEITDVVEPTSDLGVVISENTATLEFGGTFSDAIKSMAIILVNYSDVGFSYQSFTANMNGANVTDQFGLDLDPGTLTLDCDDIQPVNGSLSISIVFVASAEEGNYTFEWRYIYNAFQPPPDPPGFGDGKGETQAEVSVIKVVIDDYEIPDERCDVGLTQKIRFHASWSYGGDVKSGIIYVNGTGYTPNNNGWIKFYETNDTVVRRHWTVTGVDCSGITLYEQAIPDPAIIWDQIEIVSVNFSDSRVNVGGEADVRYTLRYDYDDEPFTDTEGTVTILGSPASYDEGGWWNRTVTLSTSVGSTNYDENDITFTDANYSLTAIEDDMGADIITDRIVVYWEQLNDSRVDVDSNIEWRVKAVLDYDDHVVGTGDSLNCLWGSLTFDAGNGWWAITHNESSVTDAVIGTWAGSEDTHGITAITENITETTGVWDRVQVLGYTVSDPRADVGANVTVDATLIYDYDDTSVTDGNVTIKGEDALHQGSGVWQITEGRESVQDVTYDTVAVANNTYGITVVDQNDQNATVIWDRIRILTLDAVESRIDVGTEGAWHATAELEYDNHQLGAGDSFTLGQDGYLFTWDGVDERFEASATKHEVTEVIIDEFDGGLEATHGITVGTINEQSAAIIWDQIEVYDGGASPEVIEWGSNSTVWFKARYDHDDSQFNVSTGKLDVNGSACSWSTADSRWEITTKESELGNYTYSVSGITDLVYGLTGFDDTLVPGVKVTITARLINVTVSTDEPRYTIDESIFINATIIYNKTKEIVQNGTFTAALKKGPGVSIDIPLTFNQSGTETWEGDYTTNDTDPVGLWAITVSGLDADGNAGSGSTTVEVNSFDLQVAPDNVTLIKGLSQEVIITIQSIYGFNSTVDISIKGLPTGVIAEFNTTQLTPPANLTDSAALNLTATLDAPTGGYNITVTGESENPNRTAVLNLSIPRPVYSIAADPSSTTLNVGSSTDINVTVTPVPHEALTGRVNLTIPDLPTGFQAEFTPDSGNQTFSSNLNLTLTQEAEAGSHVLTIRGGSFDVVYNASAEDSYITTISYNTTVTVFVPTPDYAVTAEPDSLTVYVGEQGEATINVSSINGFSKQVNLSSSTIPGVSVTFAPGFVTPAPGGPATSTATIEVDATAAPGTYSLIVTGSSGAVTHGVTISLTIPDFTIEASVSTLTIKVGTSRDLNITIGSMYGFNTPVNLSASTIPGVSVTFAPSPVTPAPASPATSTATIEVDATTEPGPHVITINGTAGIHNHTCMITLNIPEASFVLAPSTTSVTVNRNSTGSLNVTIYSINGFSSPVTLDTSSIPGVTTSFSPNPQTPPADSHAISNLTLTVSDGATPGAHTLTIYGENGNTTKSTSITLKIADFTLSVSPSSATVAINSTSDVTVSVNSLSDFNSPVTLSLETVQNVTGAFSPASVTPPASGSASSTLTVDVMKATAGVYTLNITGTSGSLTHTIQLSLVIPTPPPDPDFQVEVSPATLTVKPGDSENATVTIVPLNEFSELVALSAIMPSGVTHAFNTSSVNSTGVNASNLTLTVGTDAPSGVYTIEIRGTSTSLSRSATITLIVPDFSLSLSTPSLTMKVGEADTLNVSTSSINGFLGNVTLAASSPSGMNTSLHSNPIWVTAGGSSSSRLTVSIDPLATPKTYALNVTGTSGHMVRSVFFTVDVVDFRISTSTPYPTVPVGSSLISDLTVMSLGSFDSSVNLSISGVPGGVTVILDEDSLTPSSGGSASTALSISVSRSAVPGTSNITVQGTGSLSRTAYIFLTIPEPGFSLSVFPSSPLVMAGSNISSTVTIDSINNFESAVTLSTNASGTPGLGAAFGANPVTPLSGGLGSTLLTWSVLANVTPGSYPISVSAKSPGVENHTTIVVLTVKAPPSEPDFSFTVAPQSFTTIVGSPVTATVTVNSMNGFDESVLLFVSSPPGIASSFSPSPVTPPVNGSSTSTLTLSVSPSIAPDIYTSTLTAAYGNTSKTQQVQVKVVDYSLSALPSSITMEVGTTTTVDLYVSSVNGFSSPVTLSATSLANVSTAFAPNPVTPSAVSPGISKLTLTVDFDATPGNYDVDVYGIYGSVNRNTTISLTILTPTFSLSTSSSELNVHLNSSASMTLTASSLNGYSAPVNMSASAMSGLTISFVPDSVTPPIGGVSTATVVFTASDAALVGNHTVTINGIDGEITRSRNITLNIGDFSLNATQPSITLRNGTMGSVGIMIGSLSKFNSPVDFTSSGTPDGVSVSFSPNPVTPPADGSSTVTMHIYVDPTVAVNTSHTITIEGSSDGLSHELEVKLKVPPISENPDFTLTASPSAITLPIETDKVLTITVESLNNFTSPVTLSASAIPGVTPTFSVNPVSPPANDTITTMLSLAASPEAETGTHSLTITGTIGNMTHDANITVTIPDFDLTTSIGSISLDAGESGSTAITITSNNGFNQPVNLSTSSIPNVSLSLSPDAVIPSHDSHSSSTLTISVDPSAPYGNHSFVIYALSGSLIHSVAIDLSVRDFTLASDSVTLSRGSSNTTTVTVTGRNGFTGHVGLTAVGLPPGVSATFSPNPVILSSLEIAYLTLTASSEVTNGTYEITLMGSSSTMNRTTSVELYVPAPTYSLSADPKTIILDEGTPAGTTLIVLSLNGWDTPVNLTGVVYDSEGNTESGITETISPSTVTPPSGGTASASISVSATNVTGTYNLVINGSGSLTVTLNVTIIVPETLNATTVMEPEAVNATNPLELNGTYFGSGLRGVYLVLTEISGRTFISLDEVATLRGSFLTIEGENMGVNETTGIASQSIGQFYQLINANSSAEVKGTLRIYYKEEVLVDLGLTPQDITIYSYNETMSEWTALPTALNITAGYIETNLTHFSFWSAYGSNTPPSKVKGLDVSDARDGKLKLEWNAATDNDAVDHYRIYRDSSLVAATTSTSYTDTGLTNGQSYTYQVSAVDNTGLEGERSDQVSGTPTKSTAGPGPGPAPGGPPANKPPTADSGADQIIFVNGTVVFDASGSSDPDGTIVGYAWTFGDGGSATGIRVSHKYTATGIYNVTLTVEDNRGKTASDICIVTVSELYAPTTVFVSEAIQANETDYSIQVLDANTTVRVNTTAQVTVTLLRYEENPAPDAMLPRSIPKYIDVSVSDPDAVIWPLYVEVSYTDEEIAGLDESSLGIYYLKEGEWLRCSATGVYPDRNVAWARMTREETAGSPILVGEAPQAAEFRISRLSISPDEVEVDEPVTISMTVINVGVQAGDYTVSLEINGVVEDSEAVTLDGGESAEISFTVEKGVAGSYTIEVDGLTGSFTVTKPEEPVKPKPAEFEVSSLSVSPSEVEPDEPVQVSVTVKNVGEESGTHTIAVKVDGATVDYKDVTLAGGESKSVTFTVTAKAEGSHTVEVDGQRESFTVTVKPKPFPWVYVVVAVVIIAVAVMMLDRRRSSSTTATAPVS